MIDIVVVNWNSGNHLKKCVESVFDFCKNLKFKLIIVDNASSDGSADFLSEIGECFFLKLNRNFGFASACNLGARQSESDYILFLNPDAAIYPKTLEQLLKFLDESKNASVGICGVQLIDESGHIARSCSRFPTPLGLALHAVGISRIFPTRGQSMFEWPHDRTQDVDQVIGAFFCVRREVYNALNGFDERFFVYFEEVDFSYRARRAGWRSVYLADVQAFHAGGGTSNQVKAKRLFYSLRSRLLYSFKHFSLLGTLLVLVATLLLEPFSRTALSITRRSWSSLAETWSGYAMLYRWLPKWVMTGEAR